TGHEFMTELMKTLFQDPTHSNPLFWRYQETEQQHCHWGLGGSIQQGLHCSSSLKMRWTVDKNSPSQLFESFRNSLDGVIHDLRNGSLHEAIAKSLRPSSAWPVPDGHINLVWAAKAFSKLILP